MKALKELFLLMEFIRVLLLSKLSIIRRFEMCLFNIGDSRLLLLLNMSGVDSSFVVVSREWWLLFRASRRPGLRDPGRTRAPAAPPGPGGVYKSQCL